MPKINKANREVCDVDIRDIKTKKPFMFFDTANTTTENITSEAVYAMAKGAKRIAFPNPMDGTVTIEAQVYPFEIFLLYSGGSIESEAAVPKRDVVKCTTAGELAVPAGAVAGTVFVFKKDEWGETEIAGTYSSATNKFTATTASDIAVDSEYELGYLLTKSTGVKKITFNDKNKANAYYICMNTLDKDEEDVLTPYKMIFYKAQPQRNFELSQSSEGDPASITITFDLLSDKNGDFVEMVEINDEEY